MAIFDTCANKLAGLPILQCLNQGADYLPTILGLVAFGAVLFFRMNLEPTKDRFAVTLFVLAVISIIFSAMELLPPDLWLIYVVLAVGSIALLAVRKE